MRLEAGALLALWNDVDPALEADYEDWHAREHVPERLTVPGMLWGLRYRDAEPARGPRYLTLYGLRDAAVLDSAPYLRLLREPTPMSARMRPALRNLSRWICRLDGAVEEGAELSLAWSLQPPVESQQGWRAERLTTAAPLPWLAGGQGGGIEGRWLIGDAQPLADGRRYLRLPVA